MYDHCCSGIHARSTVPTAADQEQHRERAAALRIDCDAKQSKVSQLPEQLDVELLKLVVLERLLAGGWCDHGAVAVSPEDPLRSR